MWVSSKKDSLRFFLASTMKVILLQSAKRNQRNQTIFCNRSKEERGSCPPKRKIKRSFCKTMPLLGKVQAMLGRMGIVVQGENKATFQKIRKIKTLNNQAANPEPWCYNSDFNTIVGAHEKNDGCYPFLAQCQEFRCWLDSCGLVHITTLGAEFTLSNGKKGSQYISVRLDRSLGNDEAFNFWNSINCSTLMKVRTDHYPLLLDLKHRLTSLASSFKFHKMWINNPDCRRLISKVWSSRIYGCPMYVLGQKLRGLKNELKPQNKLVFWRCAYSARSLGGTSFA